MAHKTQTKHHLQNNFALKKKNVGIKERNFDNIVQIVSGYLITANSASSTADSW